MPSGKKHSYRTIAVQAGSYLDPHTGAVIPPIHTSTTYARDKTYTPLYSSTYSRYGNPTYDQLENVLAKLDNGVDAMVFSSGMAAIATFMETLPNGSHIVAPRIMYHGAQDWLRHLETERNMEVTFFDAGDPDALKSAVQLNKTSLVWIESPVNPTWDVIDVMLAAELAHKAGAILAIDATVATPVHMRPIELGADIVFHSATKYLNGHSDVLAGVLVTRREDDRWAKIKHLRGLMGNVCGAFEAWLLLRGIRTLHLRVERASSNALAIARRFEGHKKLDKVLYPGLESHPGHTTAACQMNGGFGGMMSILVSGGTNEARRVATATELFIPATSLGGVESLIEHRATVEGPKSAVPQNLLRLSIGTEDPADLIEDLEMALSYI
ncbi:MAG: aminotransferase class I/II-fold pyridoxal phosphate-dependent enzyme [Pseudomonadota bacterium]|nr:aminotransferase class I/II-fold pyridoxal phosphate-dependent enzyme [Pseudomonadota bacterium]